MFSKKKQIAAGPEPEPVVHEPPRKPTLLEMIQERRAQYIKLANEADAEIKAMDAQIAWIERTPDSAGALDTLVQIWAVHYGGQRTTGEQ